MSPLERAFQILVELRREQVSDKDRWERALDAFTTALEECEDPGAIEQLLDADAEDDLPIRAKTAAFQRRLEVGPPTPKILSDFSNHLWLHGPENDEQAEALRAAAEAMEAAQAVLDGEDEE